METGELSYPDDRDLEILSRLMNAGGQEVWFRKLLGWLNWPPKTLRIHLDHLSDLGFIRKGGSYRRGKRQSIELTFPSNDRWQRLFAKIWVGKATALVRDALIFRGDGSIDQQLAPINLKDSKTVTDGAFILGYRTRDIMENSGQAVSVTFPKQSHLFIGRWIKEKKKRIKLDVRLCHGRELPGIDDLVSIICKGAETATEKTCKP